jgi:uridylate kinase
VVLKITGECFVTPARLSYVVREIAAAAATGCELAIVVGGGNIIRGRSARLVDRISADQAGMVATVVNGIILERALNRQLPAHHFSALEVAGIVPLFAATRVIERLSRQHVVVLSGGTGNPLFSTDTAAALRACQLEAQAVLKGTKVKGVFSADPLKDRRARFLPRLTYQAALRRRLGIMDATAFSLCAENRIPIIVFDFFQPGNLAGLIQGERIGSMIC